MEDLTRCQAAMMVGLAVDLVAVEEQYRTLCSDPPDGFMVMMEMHVRAYPIMHAGLLLSIAFNSFLVCRDRSFRSGAAVKTIRLLVTAALMLGGALLVPASPTSGLVSVLVMVGLMLGADLLVVAAEYVTWRLTRPFRTMDVDRAHSLRP
jgi:hypothetical protein